MSEPMDPDAAREALQTLCTEHGLVVQAVRLTVYQELQSEELAQKLQELDRFESDLARRLASAGGDVTDGEARDSRRQVRREVVALCEQGGHAMPSLDERNTYTVRVLKVCQRDGRHQLRELMQTTYGCGSLVPVSDRDRDWRHSQKLYPGETVWGVADKYWRDAPNVMNGRSYADAEARDWARRTHLPSTVDVVESLLHDACTVEDANDWVDMLDQMGCNGDPDLMRSAPDDYAQCVKALRAMREAFGGDYLRAQEVRAEL